MDVLTGFFLKGGKIRLKILTSFLISLIVGLIIVSCAYAPPGAMGTYLSYLSNFKGREI